MEEEQKIMKKCFICKTELFGGKEGNFSEEHVFPDWLINREDKLKDERKTANTLFSNMPSEEINENASYTKMKVFCCKKCNNETLNNVEQKIIKFLMGKDDEYIDENLIKVWLLKIILARHVYDERRGCNSKFKHINLRMESIRYNLEKYYFHNETGFLESCSLIILEVNDTNFDYNDSLHDNFVFLQFRRKVFLLSINDYGVPLKWPYFKKLLPLIKKEKFHNFQCYEILSIILSFRKKMDIDFIGWDENGREIVNISVEKHSDKLEDVALYMARFWNGKYSKFVGEELTENDFKVDQNRYCTFLRNEKGKFESFPSETIISPKVVKLNKEY